MKGESNRTTTKKVMILLYVKKMNKTKKANKLINETSPYLLQHAHNPVNWFPWGQEAFEKAKNENKPIFLSIGYSTCHWCHVMEVESFEDEQVAGILNENYICIKVDKEERPDIDSIYMRACQAFTGGGGWPMSIFMSDTHKPFYAGTYFPKENFISLINAIDDKWQSSKREILESSEQVTEILNKSQPKRNEVKDDEKEAFLTFKQSFDKEYGGFGQAPKFPSPHNLLFLMGYYQKTNDKVALDMSEKTLLQMYKGGIFDHIGFGFSRYSTDNYWLAPHFEKMLYDNALLSMAYLRAYEITNNELYKTVATKVFEYVQRELTSEDGGFYSAQDADSDGVEGKYYVFTPDEIINILGKEKGEMFNNFFDITKQGNFEGKNIPNLIDNDKTNDEIESLIPQVFEYRKNRTKLHKDKKILTAWNGLMIASLADGYRILGDKKYLTLAENAINFIENNLTDGTTLYVSSTDGKRSSKGFLDDYAFYIFALISMYQATFDGKYLERAIGLNEKVISDFYHAKTGGFFIFGKENEQLIMQPKETYDGAMPSGNSVMYYNLSRLAKLTKNPGLYEMEKEQNLFMQNELEYPSSNSFYLMSRFPTRDIFCVLKNAEDLKNIKIKSNWVFRVLEAPTEEYYLLNDMTTFYICENNRCKPPKSQI
jgi:uncharacterized protein YyaL (SSP411 family)